MTHPSHSRDPVGMRRSFCVDCQQLSMDMLDVVAVWCDNCGALVKRSRYKDHRFSHGIVDLPDPPPA